MEQQKAQSLSSAIYLFRVKRPFAFQQLYQRRGLPHVGDAQLFDGHEVVGVEGFGHDATAGVEAVQLRQWSQHKAAPILRESGRKGESGGGPGSESGGWKQELYAC